MEGKAALFSTLVGLNAVPILLDETDPQKCIDHIAAIASRFGAIQLEDFAAPACFEIEAGLRARLDKPVLHDDQHGTAVVVLAATLNATRRAGRDLGDCVIGQIGLGAAGIGIVRLLMHAGIRHVLGTDLDEGRSRRFAGMGGELASLEDIMKRSDIVIATTGVRGLIKPAMVRKGQIIMALSNPDPEIEPAVALQHGAAIAADGKGINNVLGFPGLFKGALAAMRRALPTRCWWRRRRASRSGARRRSRPDPLNLDVHQLVATAVEAAV